MFSAVCYQNELICHFCHDWCVHPVRLMSSCVLNYAMPSLQGCLPCIFVINVVTSTSMQTRLRNVSVFRDLVISRSLCLLLFCCHVNLMLQRDPWIFWGCSVRMFYRYGYGSSIHASVWNYGVLSMTQSCSTFAIKCFWQNVNMISNFAKFVVVDPCMLWTCSWHC